MTRIERPGCYPPVEVLEELRALNQRLGHQGVEELYSEASQPPGDAVERQAAENLLTIR